MVKFVEKRLSLSEILIEVETLSIGARVEYRYYHSLPYKSATKRFHYAKHLISRFVKDGEDLIEGFYSHIPKGLEDEIERGIDSSIEATDTKSDIHELERALHTAYMGTLLANIDKTSMEAYEKIEPLVKKCIDQTLAFVELYESVISIHPDLRAMNNIYINPSSSKRTKEKKEITKAGPKIEKVTLIDCAPNYQGLEKKLREDVIRQERPIRQLLEAIEPRLAGLGKPRPPIVICTGPTGVGKTYLAERLNIHLFGRGEEELLKIRAPDYISDVSITRLIGSMPGYVGYNDVSILESHIKQFPGASVVLIDEVEKAHPKLWELILQYADDGFFLNQKGERLDYRDTIMILTTNLHSSSKQVLLPGKSLSEAKIHSRLSALKNDLKPEIMNRIDAIIEFSHLDREAMMQILEIQLKEFSLELSEKKAMELVLEDEALKQFQGVCFSEQYGARHLKRQLRRMLLSPIARNNLLGNTPDDKLIVKFEKGHFNFYRADSNTLLFSQRLQEE